MKFLIGEQLGINLGNNGFYFWKNALKKVDAYYVINEESRENPLLNNLTEREKKYIIIMDSKEHIEVFNTADMYFVTLSFKDIFPSCYKLEEIDRPLVYLQHGKLGMKKVYYTETTYYSHIYKFMYYNESLTNTLIEDNFEEYQLKYLPTQPRYEGLLKKDEKFITENDSILFFFTWRDNGDINAIFKMLNELKETPESKKIKVILHDFIELDDKNNYPFEILSAKDVDVQEELSKCEVFVTDYSSVIWDAVAIGKKSFLWWKDFKEVSANREFYISEENVENILSDTFENLLEKIDSSYNYDNYFYNNTKFDPKKVINGEYTMDLVNYFIDKINNKIGILGYNFYGNGGTVTSSKALASGYLKEDYLVEMLSMSRTTLDMLPVPGCTMKTLVDWRNREKFLIENSKIECCEELQLDYVYNKNIYNKVTEMKLDYYIRKNNFKLIISTREILHLFLKRYDDIHNIKYIFHTDFDYLKEQNPSLFNRLENESFKNGVFLTENAKTRYIEELKINFTNTQIIPNGLYEPVRRRYSKMVEFNSEIVKAEINDSKLYVNFVLKSNFNYIYRDKIQEIKICINGQNLETKMVDQHDKYPNTIEFTNAYGLELVSLLKEQKMTINIKYENREIILIPKNTELKQPEYNIIKKLSINDGVIKAKQNFIKLVEDKIVYSLYEIKGHVKLLDKSIECTEINGKRFIKVNSEQYDEKILKITSMLTEIKCSIGDLALIKQKEERKVVCAVMRISFDRRELVEEYIEFAKYLKANESQIFLSIFGGGDLLNEMKKVVKTQQLEEYIEFKGVSTNVKKDTKDIDTQLTLSHKESFGMTCLEALAADKRIFTYRNVGSEAMFEGYDDVFVSNFAELEAKILNDNYKYFKKIKRDIYPKYEMNSIINRFLK